MKRKRMSEPLVRFPCAGPICLEDLEDTCVVLQMPCSLHHVFHQDCLTEWLSTRNSCPVCRHALPTEKDHTASGHAGERTASQQVVLDAEPFPMVVPAPPTATLGFPVGPHGTRQLVMELSRTDETLPDSSSLSDADQATLDGPLAL